MPQDEKKAMSTANTVRAGGKVLPQEPVDIYALKSKSGAHLGEPGTKHSVHAVLAHKLVAKGAATLEAPKEKAEKPAKEVKLTKKELEQLTEELGHEPNEDELAEAVKAKAERADL